MPGELNDAIAAYLHALQAAKGRGAQTVANYRLYLQRFVAATGATMISQFTPQTVEQFRLWLRRDGDVLLRTPTINYHLTALRGLAAYLRTAGRPVLAPEQIRLEPMPSRQPRRVETPGINKLLELPFKLEGRALQQHRDRAILELLCTTGVRVGELSRLRRDSITADGSTLAIVSRGNRVRTVPLGNQARYWIERYLKLRVDGAPQLFVRHDPAARTAGRAKRTAPAGLTPRSVQRLVQKYARAAGLGKTVQPRVLRHTVAASLVEAGNDLETVRTRLGHASLATTKRYLPPRKKAADD
ncbi:MAG: tyrosine-type recombinase/integrase [bacterium]|nr:tyrosine-type recombinase/integrase [bacterium]